MGRGLIYLSLGLILAMAVYGAYTIWTSVDTPMPAAGWIALIAGAVLSLALAGLLMGTVFISARRGYDDRAAGPHKTPDDRET